VSGAQEAPVLVGALEQAVSEARRDRLVTG
jgi:hypothetical protein